MKTLTTIFLLFFAGIAHSSEDHYDTLSDIYEKSNSKHSDITNMLSNHEQIFDGTCFSEHGAIKPTGSFILLNTLDNAVCTSAGPLFPDDHSTYCQNIIKNRYSMSSENNLKLIAHEGREYLITKFGSRPYSNYHYFCVYEVGEIPAPQQSPLNTNTDTTIIEESPPHCHPHFCHNTSQSQKNDWRWRLIDIFISEN